MYFQMFLLILIVFHKSEHKFIEEDYHDEDKNAPHVSWVPILSRRDEKIKEAFDMIVKSGRVENEYVRKLNKIAEMLNVSYDVEDKNFKEPQNNKLKNIKNFKMKLIEKKKQNNFENNAFSKSNYLLTKSFLHMYICLAFYLLFL